MFYFKACPKCAGDLHLDHDQYGTFIQCVQCGLMKDMKLNREFAGADRSAPVQVSQPLAARQETLALTA
jgi:hypothetical protein